MANRILILGEDEVNVGVYSLLLRAEWQDVHLRHSFGEDLAEIARLAPNLIIVDLVKGCEPQGCGFLQKLKQYQPTALIPVVVCSSTTLPYGHEAYFVQHGIPVIAKPFALDDFLKQVRDMLSSPPQTPQ